MKSSDYHYVARQGCIPIRNVLIIFVIICFSLTFPGMAFVPTANATDLAMGEEAIPIYSKEDLQNVLDNIKGKLDAGFPATTELIFLEDVRNELKRQLAEVEMQIEEDLAAMPDIPGAEFNTDFDGMLDTAKRMIHMLDNIIISPSIEGIDAVLELIKTLDQEVQGDLLAARMDMPDEAIYALDKSQPLAYIETAVLDEHLGETDEIVFTDTVIAKVEEIGGTFVQMVSWVTLNIKNEFYPRSMKTADEVLVDGAGSVLDICTLLATFLRIKGIPTKYIMGYKDLTAEQFMNWTGTSTIEAAIEVIEGNNNPPVELLDDGKVRIEHVYLAFYGPNKQWVIVDPASKEYVNTPGSGFEIDLSVVEELVAAVALNEEETICSVNYAAVEKVLNTQASIYNNTVSHIDEVIGKREILATQKIIPPLYLTRGMLPSEIYLEEFSAIPSSMKAWFGIAIKVPYWWVNGETILSHVTPVAKLAGKRVSIYYEPVNPDVYNAAVKLHGSIYNVPDSRNFLMRPVLQIGGIEVAKGVPSWLFGHSNLGNYQKSRTGFWMSGTGWIYQNKYVRAGNKYDLSIPTQETSMEELKRLAEELQTELVVSGLGPDDIVTDDTILETLRLAGMFYFAAKGALARRLNIVATNHMSLGYVCDEIALAPNNMIRKAGVHIDVVRNSVKPISATGDKDAEKNYMEICGWISTGMESTMIDLAFRTTEQATSIAVSTAVIFAEAAKQGVPIHKINPGTYDEVVEDLKRVTIINPATYNHVVSHASAGYTVIIPETPITLTTAGGQWTGEGWKVTKPSGGAGYMICGSIGSYGGLIGDAQVINGGSSATIIDHPLSQIELFLHSCVIGGGPISAGLGHMVAADYVYALVATYPGYAGAIPLVLGFQVIGAALIVVGLVAFVAVYSGFWPVSACLKRRRDYAYA